MPPPKKKGPPPPVPTKESFFKPRREFVKADAPSSSTAKKVFQPNTPAPPPPQPKERQFSDKQRYLYDKDTGAMYGFVKNDIAYDINTGMELFRFQKAKEENDLFTQSSTSFFSASSYSAPPAPPQVVAPPKKITFEIPGGVRHPDERWVDVQGLVEHGLLSEENDIAPRRGFTDERLRELMLALEEVRRSKA